MILRGTIEIYGMKLSATMTIKEESRPRAYKLPGGKWRAYKTVNGIQKAFGTHDTKEKAILAARLERGPDKTKDVALGVYQKAENGTWRVMLTVSKGVRVRLGEYATFGHAVLVRDVVARRAGLKPHVPDYEMPLWMVSNAVARSYIRDVVPQPTEADRDEYQRRVDELNGVPSVRDMVKSGHLPALTLPPETWQIKQPSRSGRSPFDTVS